MWPEGEGHRRLENWEGAWSHRAQQRPTEAAEKGQNGESEGLEKPPLELGEGGASG